MFDHHVHHHHHHHYGGKDLVPPWAAVLQRQNGIIIERINQMAVDTSKILADITAQTTVLNGLVTFVQAINATNADFGMAK